MVSKSYRLQRFAPYLVVVIVVIIVAGGFYSLESHATTITQNLTNFYYGQLYINGDSSAKYRSAK